jgi:CRISPR system Cascade subunit CasA
VTAFNLCDSPWIQVRDQAGRLSEKSLRLAFHDAASTAAIAGELATQSVAILRLMEAILLRATRDDLGSDCVRAWASWWQDGLPLTAIDSYLDRWQHRFDLRDPEVPFMQVAGLTTATGATSGLVKLIGELPANHAFFTQRAGSGRTSLDAAEAARWLVHCQAFDPSGIKTGALGDAQVKGGKGYPIGVGWAGRLGLVVIEGANLAETLLLNLWLEQPDPESDRPVWEREPLGAGIEAGHPEPEGPADLFTWPSRRVLLHWQDDQVVDVQISNGDRLGPQNRMAVEPMTPWRRSTPQEKALGLPVVYMPLEHDPTRQVWRGLASWIETQHGSSRDTQNRLRPQSIEWLSELTVGDALPEDFRIRLRSVGAIYGSQSAVIDTVVDDALDAHVAAVTDPTVIALASLGMKHADSGASALAEFAGNLADATNSDKDPARQQGREIGYAALDGEFRRWFARLTPETDPVAAINAWSETILWVIRAEGERMADAAGPGALRGRNLSRPDEKPRHMDLGRAWSFFIRKLYAELSLPERQTTNPEEVPA